MFAWFIYTGDMKNEKLTLFIDLDGTVYDKHNGMWEDMSARIDHFMRTEIGIKDEDVLKTRDEYYTRYGSTLRGLQIHHNIDSLKYLAYVHDLDLSKYIKPEPELRPILQSIPHKKWIFTNSDRNHADRVLKLLGIEDLFEGIFDVWAMQYIPKPEPWTYMNARAMAGNPQPGRCVFVDDTMKNLLPAGKMGWHTVWIDQATAHPAVSYTISKLNDLPNVIERIETSIRIGRISEREIFPVKTPVFSVD